MTPPAPTPASNRWIFAAIWLAVSLVAVLACSVQWSSARLNDEYIPVGNDSFYHARRILDTVRDPGRFYEFDHRIHAPEGSLLVWPWGYDYAMATLVRIGLAVASAAIRWPPSPAFHWPRCSFPSACWS